MNCDFYNVMFQVCGSPDLNVDKKVEQKIFNA